MLLQRKLNNRTKQGLKGQIHRWVVQRISQIMTIPWTRLTHLLAGCTCIKPKCGLQQPLRLYHENGRDEFTSIRRTSPCCHENRIHLDRTLALEPIPKGAVALRPNSDRACQIQDKKSASASAMAPGSAHRHETQAKHRAGDKHPHGCFCIPRLQLSALGVACKNYRWEQRKTTGRTAGGSWVRRSRGIFGELDYKRATNNDENQKPNIILQSHKDFHRNPIVVFKARRNKARNEGPLGISGFKPGSGTAAAPSGRSVPESAQRPSRDRRELPPCTTFSCTLWRSSWLHKHPVPKRDLLKRKVKRKRRKQSARNVIFASGRTLKSRREHDIDGEAKKLAGASPQSSGSSSIVSKTRRHCQ